jgi:hypothetical protein
VLFKSHVVGVRGVERRSATRWPWNRSPPSPTARPGSDPRAQPGNLRRKVPSSWTNVVATPSTPPRGEWARTYVLTHHVDRPLTGRDGAAPNCTRTKSSGAGYDVFLILTVTARDAITAPHSSKNLARTSAGQAVKPDTFSTSGPPGSAAISSMSWGRGLGRQVVRRHFPGDAPDGDGQVRFHWRPSLFRRVGTANDHGDSRNSPREIRRPVRNSTDLLRPGGDRLRWDRVKSSSLFAGFRRPAGWHRRAVA